MIATSSYGVIATPLKMNYHYDVGYDGVFAHYRSDEPPTYNHTEVERVLKTLRSCLDPDKKGIMLNSFVTIHDCLEKLESMGFYMVNFETKKMVDDHNLITVVC